MVKKQIHKRLWTDIEWVKTGNVNIRNPNVAIGVSSMNSFEFVFAVPYYLFI